MPRRVFVKAGLVTAIAALASLLRADPFRACDRQCRSHHGFYDRRITGARTGMLGASCACVGTDSAELGEVPRRSTKAWNETFWCGKFKTDLVCAEQSHGGVLTMTRDAAADDALAVLHCGACGACSTRHDVAVLHDTADFATAVITRCATAYAKPTWLGGHRDLVQLRACLVTASVNFSDDWRAWADPSAAPSCIDCWTDNIDCDADQCALEPACLRKFIDPSHQGARALTPPPRAAELFELRPTRPSDARRRRDVRLSGMRRVTLRR